MLVFAPRFGNEGLIGGKSESIIGVVCVLLQRTELFNSDVFLQARKGLFDEPLAKMAKWQRPARSPASEEPSTCAPPILEAKNSERYYEISKSHRIPLKLRGILV